MRVMVTRTGVEATRLEETLVEREESAMEGSAMVREIGGRRGGDGDGEGRMVRVVLAVLSGEEVRENVMWRERMSW